MNYLVCLWAEANREEPVLGGGRPAVRAASWSTAMAFVWLSAERWHPQPPEAYFSGGAAALSALVVATLLPRGGRAAVVLLAAIGLAGYVAVPGRAAAPVGLGCLALALLLSAHLGRFGMGLAVTVAVLALVATVVRYGETQPLVLLSGAVAAVWLYAGLLLGRMSRRAMRQEAAAEERARLAREVHDVLAHTLSALSVQIQGARMLLEQRPGDPRALAAMERAQRLVAAGIEETGQAVAALRGEGLAMPDALRRLAEEFQRESRVRCRLDLDDGPLSLSPDASLTIYRTAQEALTNIRKHADAFEVSIGLRRRDGRAELTIADRGAPRPSLASTGYGLLGIRERAKLLGGELDAGPTADGFRVRLSVPA